MMIIKQKGNSLQLTDFQGFIRSILPVCRAGDAEKTGGEDRRSGQCGCVFAQSAVEWHQFPTGSGGRGYEHELF